MKNAKPYLFLLILHILVNPTLLAQLTALEAVELMGRGINIGNTLDPPEGEGTWNNPPVEEYYFDDYKNAGFQTVRIPITWSGHTSWESPYRVDTSWLDRVEEIINWGLNRDLFIIINAHHEEWKWEENAYEDPEIKAMFDSIWSQVSRRFKDKSDKLLFEIFNEPWFMTQGQVDEMNTRVLNIIRETNPTRLVIFPGTGASHPDNIINAHIPDKNDPYLMAYFHYYIPSSFTQEGGTWGTKADVNRVKFEFNRLKNWSERNNIPLMLSEFGAVPEADYNSRMHYYATLVEKAVSHNYPFMVWDNGGDGIYYRSNSEWSDLKEVLINIYDTSPNNPALINIDTSVIQFTWENRTTKNDILIVERRNEYTKFGPIVSLSPDANNYFDSSVVNGINYYYRVKTILDTVVLYSRPIRIFKELPVFTHVSNSISGNIQLEVFPNPAKNHITIKYAYSSSNARLTVRNLQGKIFYSKNIHTNEVVLSVSEWPKGIYYLQVVNKDIPPITKTVAID